MTKKEKYCHLTAMLFIMTISYFMERYNISPVFLDAYLLTKYENGQLGFWFVLFSFSGFASIGMQIDLIYMEIFGKELISEK